MADTFGRFVSNVIEFVFSGVLFLSTLAVLFRIFFPQSFVIVWNQLATGVSSSSSDTLLFVVGTAFAYAAGSFADYLSRITFEWRLDQVKKMRQQKFSNPISYGNMRFAIMARHPDLYLEVESQLKRMRIERVLALCLALLLLAATTVLLQDPSWFRFFVVIALAASLSLTIFQVEQRFQRYCRAIERGYIEVEATKEG